MTQIHAGSLSAINAEVLAAVTATLEAARGVGGVLADVITLTVGNRQLAGKLEPPAVWALPRPNIPQRHGGHTATVDFTFWFVAVVKNVTDPEQGLDDAVDLMYRVVDVMLADRTLGVATIEDVIPQRYDPAHRAADAKQVFFAAAEIAVRVRRRE